MSQPIRVGDRVRVHFLGSKRDGKLGRVSRIKRINFMGTLAEEALVIVEGVEPHLRQLECLLPGSELMHLERFE